MSVNVKALRRERGEVCDKAKSVLDSGNTPENIREFEKLMAKAEDLKGQIARAEALNELDQELSAPIVRRAGKDNMFEVIEPANHWADAKTGEVIKVLRAGDSFCNGIAQNVRREPSLGEVVRGMLNPGSVGIDVRNALSEGSSPSGGYLVPETLSGQVIDKLRNAAVCTRAGALTVNMPTPQVHMAKLVGDPSGSWRGEAATVEESTPSFGRVTLDANSLACVIKISRELSEDATNLDVTLTNAIAQSFAVELDRACLYGNGVMEPKGLTEYSDINVVSMGADGAALSSYDNLLDALYEMHLDHAGDPGAIVMHPRTERDLLKMKDGDGMQYQKPLPFNTIPFLSTTAVPITETQGNATTASSVLMGNWSDMVIGIRSNLRIELLRERYADNLQFGLLCFLRADVAITRPESFCRVKGILATS
jgi:HK97 family phage major capsid protein